MDGRSGQTSTPRGSADELEILSDLARSLVTTTRLGELLREIVSAVGRVLRFHDCVLYLWDEEEGALVQRAAYGPKQPVGRAELVNPSKLRLGEGIVGSVAESGVAEVIGNTELDPRFVRDLESNLSELTVPIRFQGELIGVLDAEAPGLAEFTAADLAIVGRFADLCAPAIVNAQRLRAETERAEAALRAAEQRFQAIVEKAHDAVYTVDPEGRFTYVNPAAEKLFGRSAADLVGVELVQVVAPDARRRADRFLAAMASELEQEVILELPVIGFGGSLRWTEQTVSRHGDAQRFEGFQAIVRDVTHRRDLERRLEHLANHDPLTGLYNRYRFEIELRAQLERANESRRSTALLWIDLDRFKDLNESRGHHVGDELLVQVGRILRQQTRTSDVVARFGGDEFAVLLRDADAELGRLVADRVLGALRHRTFLIDGRSCRTSASIGIVLLPRHADRPESALARVDRAMYRAKEDGRDRYHLYRPSADGERVESGSRVAWVDRIRTALEESRFRLYVQPIVPLGRTGATKRGATKRYEVLLRLDDARDGIILPGAFIPIAERYGLIQEIDRWVVTESIGWLGRVGGDSRVELEVNLSGKAFSDPKLLATVREECDGRAVDPTQLILEITEAAALADVRHAQRFVESLRAVGCRFALDDFGVGFSSLYHLKQLPIDYLKLDGSLVRDLKENEVDQHLIRSMVEIARGLGKRTIASCVEDEEILALLESYGVDFAQGHHLAAPRPIEQALAVPESDSPAANAE